MLTIRRPVRPGDNDVCRRDFLTVGGLSTLGLSLPSMPQATNSP